MSNVVSQHPANQAILSSLANPLTQALASFLCTLPSKLIPLSSEMASAHLPSQCCTDTQTELLVEINNSTGKPSKTPAAQKAADDSLPNKQRMTMSALTEQLRSSRAASSLTAQLKGHATGNSSGPDQVNTRPGKASVATAAHMSQGSTSPQAPHSGSKQPANSALRLEIPHEPEAETEPSQGSSSIQRSKSAGSDGMHGDDLEVQLARRFTFHVLLHLPAASLKDKQALWMEHAVGLPELMQCCVDLTVEQAPRVSHSPSSH